MPCPGAVWPAMVISELMTIREVILINPPTAKTTIYERGEGILLALLG